MHSVVDLKKIFQDAKESKEDKGPVRRRRRQEFRMLLVLLERERAFEVQQLNLG